MAGRRRVFTGQALIEKGALVLDVREPHEYEIGHVPDMRLRGAGFGDVVVASTRDHAYLPMIGAILGAISSIGLVRVIERLFRRPEK